MNRSIAVALVGGLLAALGSAQVSHQQIIDSIPGRELGPTTMGGRVSQLAVYEKEPRIFYTATASSGLWKTTNAGITMEPVFYKEKYVALGAVAVSQNDPDIVWVGTGEQNSRNSTSYGGGVYRSTDGGESWEYLGLKETRQISKIRIHPTNENVAYVAALGGLWGYNEERGVYKTTDGGKTWSKVFYVDDKTGAIDLIMTPGKPDELTVAMWERRRWPYRWESGGPGSGLFRTTNGGRDWNQITDGMPEGDIGRIGMDVMQGNPNVWVATIEAMDDGRGTYRSTDGGSSWEKVNDLNPRPFYFSMPRQDPVDEDRIYVPAVNFHYSTDKGENFRTMRMNVHVDYHGMWINPKDNNHMIVGSDGGVSQTRDRGQTWEHLDYLRAAQFYAIGVDMRKPYYVYGGLQDNGTWGGPTQAFGGGVTTADWYFITGGDGFHAQVDPTDWRIIYSESQGGALRRTNQKTGESAFIRPRPPRGTRYRFNWSAPILISPHNPHTIYFAGQFLFKSVDRGDNWKTISPDLTLNDPKMQERGGGVTPEDTGAERHNTIITIGESPLEQGVLWVGTDDGKVWLSRDDGDNWTDLSAKFVDMGVPANTWVSRVEPSHHEIGRAYVTFDGHRQMDFAPYVFMTDDFGDTWKRIDSGIPTDNSVYVIHEGLDNDDLLIVGTELGLFVSLDRGDSWSRYTDGTFHTVRVDDLVIHPRELDLVVGTHGRGIWILPFAALEQLTAETRSQDVALLNPTTMYMMGFQPGGWFGGDRLWTSPNTQPNGDIWYWLKEETEEDVQIKISLPNGDEVATLNGSGNAGLNKVTWRPNRRNPAQEGEYTVVLSVGDQTYQTAIKVEDLSRD